MVLPDTQTYSQFWPETFAAQTQWIVDHQNTYHIEYVLHEGDIVNYNVPDQWTNALNAMSGLHGHVAYALSIGNHDTGNDCDVRSTRLFNIFFPYSHYANLSNDNPQKVRGVFEPNKLDNAYYYFSAGGTKWLILSLEFGPRDAVLEWANQVVASHLDRRVIVLTHNYLNNVDQRSGDSWATSYWAVNTIMAKNGESVNDGAEIWDNFVRKHSNISFVFCGHFLGDGVGSS